jgi:F-type H+-transporting ATPase subunit b
MFIATAYAAEEAAGHGASAGFPPFDASTFPSQLLWLAITFGLFYLFLKKVVLPRIGNILEVRRDRIASDLDQAARMKDEADAAIAAYEQELADARTRANAIGQQARDGAKAGADAERKKVEAELEAKLAAAEGRIAAIKQTALGEVGSIAGETATAIVEHLIGRQSTAGGALPQVAALAASGAPAAALSVTASTARSSGARSTAGVTARAPAAPDDASGEARPSLDDPNRPKGVARPAKPDDLKLLRGVGPKIEGILHSLGIFTYAQVGKWTAAERDWVDGYLRFKGRIERDDWIRQAQALAKGGVDEYVRVFGRKPV